MRESPATMISFRPGKLVFLCIALIFNFLFTTQSVQAQEIEINAENVQVNALLIYLASEYEIQISFDDSYLSGYQVTVSETFNTPEQALRYLLRDIPVEIIFRNGIYILKRRKKTEYILNGSISDFYTGEKLPFSHIVTPNGGLISDDRGNFSMMSTDSLFNIKASYLGYYILDTLLKPGDHHIRLIPSVRGLKEVTVLGSTVERTLSNGDAPGKIRLNHKTARRLPGNGDNSVFNYLRLQPGILAAGEQSGDLIIWGGYEGHSAVQFDGMTLFGLKNFNDNISAVNPYMVKDVLILKGGYGAEFGNRVGGIVNITGVDGNNSEVDVGMNVNNMTVSSFISIPFANKATFTGAFRRTYYNLYDADDFGKLLNLRQNHDNADISVSPEYNFGDWNLKFSGSGRAGEYSLNYFQGKDHFRYAVDRIQNGRTLNMELNEIGHQRGGAMNWNYASKNGLISSLSAGYSRLHTRFENNFEVMRTFRERVLSSRQEVTENRVDEYNLRQDNHLTLGARHNLSLGWQLTVHNITLAEEFEAVTQPATKSLSTVAGIYIKDRITLGTKLILIPGIRLDIPVHLSMAFPQPRISANYRLTSEWKVFAAWGMYRQFISQTSVLDESGNYQYFWAVADQETVPVLHSFHHVTGVSYEKGKLALTLEGFYKTTDGLTRYIQVRQFDYKDVFPGYGLAYGGDFSSRLNFGRHEAWVAYTWSKTREYFAYFPVPEYRYAPHDQRHELKSALMLNFNPVYLSVNYVYGSGFIESHLSSLDNPVRYPYSRLDAAVIYNFTAGRFDFEAGISVLNLLNTQNIKHANFIRVPIDQLSTVSIHAEAVPFTPTIYLNASF